MDIYKHGCLVTQAPSISDERLRTLLKEIFGIIRADLIQLTGYDDLNFKLDNCEFDGRNEKLCQRKETTFILKFTNPIEAKYPELLGNVRNFLTPCITCAEHLPNIHGSLWKFVSMTETVNLPIRLLSFLKGQMLEQIGYSIEIYKLIGKFIARFHRTTENYDDSGFRYRKTGFSLENLNEIEKEFYYLIDNGQFQEKEHIHLCEKAFNDLRKKVFEQRDKFEQGLIHSDFNETNLLVDLDETTNKYEIVGLLDFGDTHYSFRIFDIANALLYLWLDVKATEYNLNFFLIGNYLIEGYREVRHFSDPELFYLSVCMRARMSLSLIYAKKTAFVNYRNVNVDYILKTQSNGWQMLELMTETNFESMNLSYG